VGILRVPPCVVSMIGIRIVCSYSWVSDVFRVLDVCGIEPVQSIGVCYKVDVKLIFGVFIVLFGVCVWGGAGVWQFSGRIWCVGYGLGMVCSSSWGVGVSLHNGWFLCGSGRCR
jgi:hypothetical protein